MNTSVYCRSVSDPGNSYAGCCITQCNQGNCSFHLDKAYSKKQNHEDFCSPDTLQPAEVACRRGSECREKKHTWHSSLQSCLLGTGKGPQTTVCPSCHSLSPPTPEREKEDHTAQMAQAQCRGSRKSQNLRIQKLFFLREQRERSGGWEHLSQSFDQHCHEKHLKSHH